jgi:hypothetical protein
MGTEAWPAPLTPPTSTMIMEPNQLGYRQYTPNLTEMYSVTSQVPGQRGCPQLKD